MKYSELKRKLRAMGCKKVGEGGRHEIWLSPITNKPFSVGRHDNEDVPPGTLHAIKKESGLK